MRQGSFRNFVRGARIRLVLLALGAAVGAAPGGRSQEEDDDSFRPLFNGSSLDGWVNVNCAPGTWTAADGVIRCSGKPTGALRTESQYENFILEVEWRHLVPGGNAGIFIWAEPISAPGVPFLRSVEVQVLDTAYGNTESHTTHGDVFPIHGSTMKPFPPSRGSRSFPTERRSKPSPEWNHYRITCRDGTIRLAVNGKEVSGGSECDYRKGYLALESEGGVVEYRGLRISELPSSNPPAEQVAPESVGFRSLYTGVDLSGWKSESPESWSAKDWTLVSGGGSDPAAPLVSEQTFADFQLIIDVQTPEPNETPSSPPLLAIRGDEPTIALGGSSPGSLVVGAARADASEAEPFRPDGWNRYTVTVQGSEVTVDLNGSPIVTKADIPSLPATGPIALVPSDALNRPEIKFSGIYVREL